MMDITTKYLKIIENKKDNNNNLKISFYYDLGGYNYFTHDEKRRGYYISVTPCSRCDRGGYFSESIAAFSGYYELLQPCSRKSKKAESAALEKLPAYKQLLIDYICNKNGYIIEN